MEWNNVYNSEFLDARIAATGGTVMMMGAATGTKSGKGYNPSCRARKVEREVRMAMTEALIYNTMLQDTRLKSCCFKDYTNANSHLFKITIFGVLFCSPTRTPWSERD